MIAIWLVNKEVFKDFTGFHSHFSLYDDKNKLKLTEHANIHVIELCKWNKSRVEDDLDRWTRFFREGKNLSDSHLPQYMLTEEMDQAMAVLKQFSEKESAYDRYRSRINYLRDQITMEEEKELAKAEAVQAKAEKEQAKVEAEQAKAKAETDTKKAEEARKQSEVELKQANSEIEKLKSQILLKG